MQGKSVPYIKIYHKTIDRLNWQKRTMSLESRDIQNIVKYTVRNFSSRHLFLYRLVVASIGTTKFSGRMDYTFAGF